MNIDKKYSSRHKRELWGYDGRINGKRHRDRKFETKKMAEEAWNALFQSVVRGDYGIAKQQTITLKSAFDLYVGMYRAKSQNKSAAYQNHLTTVSNVLERFVERMGPAFSLRRLTLTHMIEWANGEGKSPETTAAYAQRVAGMLTMAKEHFPELASWNPPKLRDYAQAPGSDRFRIVSPEEAHMLLVELRKSGVAGDRDAADVFQLALLTGMRSDEILRLAFDNILYKSKRINVVGTKTGENRVIPLPNSVITLVHQRQQDGLADAEHVFPKRHSVKLYGHTIREALLRAAKRIGVDYGRSNNDGFTIHDARATYLTHMSRHISIGTLRKLSGHKTLSALQRYLRPLENEEAIAAQVADEFLTWPGQFKAKVVGA